MHYLDAREIIARNKLIPRRNSRLLINALVKDLDAHDFERIGLSAEEYENLRTLVRTRAAEIAQRRRENSKRAIGDSRWSAGTDGWEGVPRNEAIYSLIRDRIPGFEWKVRSGPGVSNSERVTIKMPLVEGIKPSLASLLLLFLRDDTNSLLHERYQCVYRLDAKITRDLSRILERRDVATPSEEELDRVVQWLERGLAGEQLTMVTPVCPDYEAKEVASNLYRYTFDKLGSGIGVVAKRFLGILPLLDEVFRSVGVDVRFIVAIGDFEGFSEETLQRIGLSSDRFRNQLIESQESLAANAPVEIQTPLFTDLCGGPAEWQNYLEIVKNRLAAGDFGETGLDEEQLTAIAFSRKELYRRWFPGAKDDKVRDIFSAQSAEYATMGHVIADRIVNPLIFGADHLRMAPLFWHKRRLPTLYLRNNYLGVA